MSENLNLGAKLWLVNFGSYKNQLGKYPGEMKDKLWDKCPSPIYPPTLNKVIGIICPYKHCNKNLVKSMNFLPTSAVYLGDNISVK